MNHENQSANFLQVKICGLTSAHQARACARLGADAIGLIFYPPSPRHVAKDRARLITAALPAGIAAVGVFVDACLEEILETADHCGLTAIQLHGRETPRLVVDLKKEGLRVIKALFADRPPVFAEAADYVADAFLAECGRGPLPGGNAMTWDWSAAAPLARRFSLVLAGGLGPENIAAALDRARPHAVDVSSGVEICPGVKDLERVQALIETIKKSPHSHGARRIFS